MPNLSTTYCLACYPQYKCQGGNPGQLILDISKGGISTNNCIDYSWCLENDVCNGSALSHFSVAQRTDAVAKLNSTIPDCGCYFAENHYLYFIDQNPTVLAIGEGGVTEDNIASTVKKHIWSAGPVMGGFIVFANFMPGQFSLNNGGVYLENGVYDSGGLVKFDSAQSTTANYKGTHAIAIIGWGIASNILIDNNGTRKDVPYWYCRNSWKDTWGESGCFKMAMYPYNQISQFDRHINIVDQQGLNHLSGGIVMFTVSKTPDIMNLSQINDVFMKTKRLQSDEYYKSETKEHPSIPSIQVSEKGNGWSTLSTSKKILKVFLILTIIFIILIVLFIGIRYKRKHNKRY